MNNDLVDQCVRDEVEKFNRKLDNDTLVDEDPVWCSNGTKGSNNECCLSTCTLGQCGSTQNFWVELTLGMGFCYDSNDNTEILNQTTCCGQTSGCCEAGCCKRDISTICQDADDTKCTIDPNAVKFIVPEDPCTSVVDAIQFQGIWALDSFSTIRDSLKSSTKTNIDNTFQCLYYSYFVTEYSCLNLTQPQREECQNACDNVKNPSFIIEASVFGDKNDEGYFNYLFPAILPRQRDIPTFLQLELGVYGLADTSLTVENAATFIIDVFDEFMGCAVSAQKPMACRDHNLYVILTCNSLFRISCLFPRMILWRVCIPNIQMMYKNCLHIITGPILMRQVGISNLNYH